MEGVVRAVDGAEEGELGADREEGKNLAPVRCGEHSG